MTEKAALPKKFLIKAEDALTVIEKAPDKIDWLVEGLLPSEGLSIIGSKPKAGKTTFVTELMTAVAEERPFLSKTTKCVDALYLYLEGPKIIPPMRFKQLGYTGTRGKIALFREMMPRKGVDGLIALEKYLMQNPDTKLVVVDTLAKLIRLPDSDKYDAAVGILELLENIAKEHHVHILGVLHNKKRSGDETGDGLIGSTAFRGSTDVNIFIGRQGEQRILETEQRLGDHLEPTQLNLDKSTGLLSLGKPMEEVEESRNEARVKQTRQRIENAIVDLLLASGAVSQSQIVSQVPGRAETRLEVLREMETNKRIAVSDVDGKKMYSLAEIAVEKTGVNE
jgi:AAA domain